MFRANGEVVQPSEVLYKKPILVERGSFRPATKLTLDLLERALEEDVNIVNAELLLRERGIKLTEESRAEPGAFSSSMSAEVTSSSQEKFVASGTLHGDPRNSCKKPALRCASSCATILN